MCDNLNKLEVPVGRPVSDIQGMVEYVSLNLKREIGVEILMHWGAFAVIQAVRLPKESVKKEESLRQNSLEHGRSNI